MSAPHGDRRVGQLRNDVDDIYDMLGVINGTLADHTATLDQHTATLAEHTVTLDQHTATLAKHSTILADHTIRLTSLESKLDHVVEWIDRH